MSTARAAAIICAAFLFVTQTLLTALAQDYPARSVTIVVPFTPGGTTDILARLLGQKLSERLGRNFIVENRPGAGTVIGSNAVAKAAPDGYTLLMATSTPMAINATLHKNLPYNPATDLVPIGMVAESPFALVVHPSLPVKSVADLIKLSKDKPGELSYGSGGPGAPHHLFMELFKTMAGVQLTHVPYKGTLPALNDVVGGQIQVMFSDLPPALELIRAGQLRAIAISSKDRVAALPDVPTVAESGLPGYQAVAWLGLAAPGDTPRPVIEKLFAEARAIVATGDVQAQIGRLGMTPMGNPSLEELKSFVLAEITRWGEVVKVSGASAE
jgi:tripartite-type tricarboxylate transporter receptor subunit TctC